MKLKKCLALSFLLALFSEQLYATSFDHYATASLSMVNLSYTETESQLEDDNTLNDKTPASSSASVISLDVSYDIPLDIKKTMFFKGVFPFMTATGSSLVSLSGGMNYFFKSMSSSSSGVTPGSNLKVFPQWRYFAGGQVGVGYLIYTTDTAKKSDIMIQLAIQGGVIYNLGEKWGVKGELVIGRGSGTAASATNMSMMAGLTYTIGE